MSTHSVTLVQQELGLTEDDIQTLKGVRLVWSKLESLRKQALKDDRYVKLYRDLLAKSLIKARAVMAPDDPEQIALESRLLWDWVSSEFSRLGISEIEARRGMACFPWCEKWLPALSTEYNAAVGRMVELPSKPNIDDVKTALSKLLQAYIGAV